MSAPDGRRLAVGLDKTIQFWNSRSWTVETEFNEPTMSVTASAWSPDGSLVATVAGEGALRIHDANNLTTRTELRLDAELNACAWLANDRLAVVGGHRIYWLTYQPGDPQ
jgi:WD40 repeat protein